ncbi:hypothetical protein NE634_15555 [Lacrimispora saccharolytica]|nr:hypothetical protein [Lacrimispora saccharolytica]
MAKIEELNEKQLEAAREAMLMAGLEDDDATIEDALTEDGINTPLVFMEYRGKEYAWYLDLDPYRMGCVEVCTLRRVSPVSEGFVGGCGADEGQENAAEVCCECDDEYCTIRKCGYKQYSELYGDEM